MVMMRRWAAVVPLLMALSGVAGCGDDEAATSTSSTTTETTTTTTVPTTTTTTTTVPGRVTIVVRLEITGGVGSGEGVGTFTATGSAVDAGTVCPSGAAEWALRSRTEKANFYEEETTITATCDEAGAGFTLTEKRRVKYGIVSIIEGSWTAQGAGTPTGWVGEGTETGTCSETGGAQFLDCETVHTGVIAAEG